MECMPGISDAPYRPTGHPHDPCTPDLDDGSAEIVDIVGRLAEIVGDAQKLIDRADYDAAAMQIDEIRSVIGSDPALIDALERVMNEAGAILLPTTQSMARKALRAAA